MYQALARQWRPKTFASLRGQTHVTRALINALKRQQLHHAYLFTGTRGVGKTTIARILAKSFNCEQGISPEPCGTCRACLEIDQGSYVDVLEIDAASRTRVEDTREILENVQYAPTQGRFKIYIIDEVHMLSTHSFNALLKTLEEPPAHVKFILATTDPDKIPMTILSRCLRLNLCALSVAEVMTQCEQILTREQIPFDTDALRKIAVAAKGSMRDGLSLLEQAIADGNGTVQAPAVTSMLGLSYQQHMGALLQGLFGLNVEACLQAVEQMAQVAADYETVLAELLHILHAIAIAQAVPTPAEPLAMLAEIDPAFLGYKDQLTPETVQLLYQIGLQAQKDLAYAPSLRSGFEMTLLRMCVFTPVSTDTAISNERTNVRADLGVGLPMGTAILNECTNVVPSKDTAISNERTNSVAPVSVAPISAVTLPDWNELVTKLPLAGLTRSLVRHCVVTSWENDVLQLTLDNSQKACFNPQRKTQIQEAISQYMGKPIKVMIHLGEVQTQTPVHQAKVQSEEKQAALEKTVVDNPLVQHLLDTFQGSIQKVTSDETSSS